MRLLHQSSLLLLGLAGLACTSTATTTTITRPELVQVLPEDFLGTQHCGQGPGLVGSYVATLFDVTTDSSGKPLPETGFPLPSSPPTSCELPVTFSYVLANHSYRAEIDAYEDLFPQANAGDAGPDHIIQAVSLGGRLQQTAAGARVSPRWKVTCGGYPPTDADGGNDSGSDASDEVSDSGDASPPGVVSYDTLTTTVHDCGAGLIPVN